MSVVFNENVYGLTDMGEKIKIGETKVENNNMYYVGGKIFYIDAEATGRSYHFYNERGIEISDVKVGDEVYAYSVSGDGSKDKFYVYYPTIFTLTRWTYKNGDNYAFHQFGTPTADYAIGQGKTISTQVMNADDGAYIANDVDGTPTAWYRLNQLNNAVASGCSDWYMPSRNELEALYNAQDQENNYIARSLFTEDIWTASEDNEYVARILQSSDHTFAANMKSANNAMLAIRSF